MTVRTLLIGSSLTAVAAGGIWLAIIFFLNPEQAGPAGYVLFFLSLFLMLSAGLTLLGFGLRRLLNPDQLVAYRVRGALRQGVMISLFFNLLLLLVRARLYQWWVAVVLIVIFVALEVVFLGYDRSLTQRSYAAQR